MANKLDFRIIWISLGESVDFIGYLIFLGERGKQVCLEIRTRAAQSANVVELESRLVLSHMQRSLSLFWVSISIANTHIPASYFTATTNRYFQPLTISKALVYSGASLLTHSLSSGVHW